MLGSHQSGIHTSRYNMGTRSGLLGNLSIATLITVLFRLFFASEFSFIACFAVFSVAFTATTVLDIASRDVARSHSLRSALDQYFALNFLNLLGWIFYKILLKDTKNIQQTQTRTLLGFLRANSTSEFGMQHHSSSVKNTEDFRRQFPLTTDADYESSVQRMMDGARNVLTSKQPVVFAVTSGTSGRSNILPFLRKQRAVFFFRGITVMSHIMMKHFPQTKCLRKGVKFFYSPRWRTSPAGIPIGPNSSSPTSTKSILHLYSTPKVGYDIASEPDALYVHLLFALKDREIGLIEANFASLVYYAFQFLEANKDDLIDNIRKGRVKSGLSFTPEIRVELEKLLTPDEQRADDITDAFANGSVGIAKRLWPKMALVLCVDSGAFGNYGQVLREKYCEGVPLYSPLYAATEGLIGLNVWPLHCPSRYLLMPTAMFFEFIPLDRMDELQPETLLLHQVKCGEPYEVVLTNASGLCRFRFGDVVRVIDFVNQCPVVEFLYRKGQLLNVRGEKTSEKALYDALMTAARDVGAELVDYTTCESVLLGELKYQDQSRKLPFYAIFIEFSDVRKMWAASEMRDLAAKIDEALQDSSYVYKSFRTKNAVGLPEVYVLRSGAFSALRAFLLTNSEASANQIKIPRVMKKTQSVEFLLNKIVKD
ncbi:GH3 domain-containing protein-like [Paramacrobiotus metropolitanus]|uniref:GH3 domain-containing protein-like n=1 Tax=Paramacrobiotus metropolitanus TaxID=2943436 RepID=UPI002445A571|nr:GH3 domain-containing protein-like [Paramacrobiotus metropolitanus]